jgi:hypothetical protein
MEQENEAYFNEKNEIDISEQETKAFVQDTRILS